MDGLTSIFYVFNFHRYVSGTRVQIYLFKLYYFTLCEYHKKIKFNFAKIQQRKRMTKLIIHINRDNINAEIKTVMLSQLAIKINFIELT